MKSNRMKYLAIAALLCTPTGAYSQHKQIDAVKLARIANPQKADEFQVGVQFALPQIPANAILTNAIMAIDRRFEAVKDNSKPIGPAEDLPRGLVNKTDKRLVVAVYTEDGKQQQSDLTWASLSPNQWKKISTSTLPDLGLISQERQAGRWQNRATEFNVTSLVREQMKNGRSNLSLVIAGAAPTRAGLKKDEVDADESKLSASLILLYVLEPLLPPWTTKK